jgi:hypothetical protein
MRYLLVLIPLLAACALVHPRVAGPSMSRVTSAVDSVVIVIKAPELFEGDDADITAMRVDHGQSISCEPEWESLNPNVVTISKSQITAHHAGSATVRATCMGKSGAITVAVSPRR